MEIGTGLITCQRRPDEGRSTAALYEEALTLAERTEAAGLASAWVSEHHFLEDGYLSGTTPTLGALAAVTDSIEIGSCIAPAPLHDPVRLAEDAATVDLLSDGRLTLGLAIGSNPRELEGFGVPADERADRLEDTVRLLRAAWSAGPLDYDSAFHPAPPEVSVTPKPDGGIPVMLGGSARPAVRRAARTADAWCAPSALSVEGVRKRAADVRSVREEEGLDGDFTVYVLQHGFLGDSREEAWETMRDGYFYLQRRYAEIFSGESVDELDADRRRELKEAAVFGTPDGVSEQLETYRAALADAGFEGDDVHFVLRTYFPGLDTGTMGECIDRLGDEVAPRF